MTYETLLLAVESGIATLTINRPASLNALNQQVFSDLKSFFSRDFEEIEGLRGVIVTGAGDRAFVAGADISEFSKLDPEAGAAMAKRGQDIFFLIENFHVAVVAAVNGFALGGGCELAMACHIRVAGEKAKFGQPEVNLGLIPGYGGSQRLPQLIGKSKAMELLLTADLIGADEAFRLGLVNYVVPAGEELAKSREILTKIASKAPLAISKTIDAVNAFYVLGGRKGFEREVDAFGDLCSSDDFREGAAAFMEKRKANFLGK